MTCGSSLPLSFGSFVTLQWRKETRDRLLITFKNYVKEIVTSLAREKFVIKPEVSGKPSLKC